MIVTRGLWNYEIEPPPSLSTKVLVSITFLRFLIGRFLASIISVVKSLLAWFLAKLNVLVESLNELSTYFLTVSVL